jgi:hypothetical protein
MGWGFFYLKGGGSNFRESYGFKAWHFAILMDEKQYIGLRAL